MPVFRYKVLTEGGELAEGRLDFTDKEAAIAHFRRLGQLPIRIEPVGLALADTWAMLRGRGLDGRDLALATRQIATLVEAGMVLDRALDFAAAAAERPATRAALSRSRERLTGGACLSDALAAEAGTFPPVYVAMVRAGEAGGAIGAVMARLADFLERADHARRQLQTALIYPAILMIAAIAILTMMVAVVLPQFDTLFADAGARLPWGARLVVAGAGMVRSHGWAVAMAALGAGLILARALQRPAFRLSWDRALLRLPLAGPLARKAEAARFCRTLAALLANGVGHLAALAIVQAVLGNSFLRAQLAELIAGLKDGQGLAEPLARLDMLPPLALQLVRLGEETGKLDTMLGRAADILEGDVHEAVARLLGLLTPVLTILLGVAVAAIIGAVLSAILSIYDLPV
jgi:general secretion pathway protein F